MKTSTDTPDKTHPASTVILVREEDQELQVYLLKRSSGSGFFPGNYVFPGGTLEEDDWKLEFWKDRLDLSGEEIDKTFGLGLELDDLIAYGVAAIRETLEEAGVFLARQKSPVQGSHEMTGLRPPAEAMLIDWFRNKVLNENWTLSFSRLFPWSHWITPVAMSKRFDTRFFIALMPEGQVCVPDDRETVHGLWVSPLKGLQENIRGEIPLSPPTLITLHELLPYNKLADLTNTLRPDAWAEPQLPVLFKLEKGAVIVEPWDPQYGKEIEIEPKGLEQKVAAIGAPFSRLWLHKGIWRPLKF